MIDDRQDEPSVDEGGCPWGLDIRRQSWTSEGSGRTGVVVVEGGLDSDRTTTRDLDATRQAPDRICYTWFTSGRYRIIQRYTIHTKYGYSG